MVWDLKAHHVCADGAHMVHTTRCTPCVHHTVHTRCAPYGAHHHVCTMWHGAHMVHMCACCHWLWYFWAIVELCERLGLPWWWGGVASTRPVCRHSRSCQTTVYFTMIKDVLHIMFTLVRKRKDSSFWSYKFHCGWFESLRVRTG